MESKRLMIATPMYGGMCTGHYTAGVIQSIMYLQRKGVSTYWYYLMNESLITRARNELVHQFLQTDSEYLMFIDADIGFPSEAIHTLIEADEDIVCGIYPKKEVDWLRVQAAAEAGDKNVKDYAGAFVLNTVQEGSVIGSKGLFEVRHGGTGFMLIKRSVFGKLKDHVPTYRTSTVKDAEGNYVKPLIHEYFTTSIDPSGALLSEDYHFCELWRKHGGKLFANPFIKLEHIGTYVYTGDILKAGGNLK